MQFHLQNTMYRTPYRHSGHVADCKDGKGHIHVQKRPYDWIIVFSPWSRTIFPFPSLHQKIQAFQDENRQTSAWNKSHAMSYFSALPQPKCRHSSGKTRTRWSNWRDRFNPLKIERYNMQDRDTIDFNKIDIVKPIPKQLCMRTQGECTYCQFVTPHPSATPSDWSSEDWVAGKAKAREECLLLDFNILENRYKRYSRTEHRTHHKTWCTM